MREKFKEFVSGYSISTLGRVRNDVTGCFRTPQERTKGGGYKSVNIKGKNYYIHRLVATAFLSGKQGCKIVNHIDFNRGNNILENLEWCSTKSNNQHSISHGRHTYQVSSQSKARRVKPNEPSAVRGLGPSGVKGVKIKRGPRGVRYLVYFNRKNAPRYLGSYGSLEDAKKVYKEAHIKAYGIDPYK